MIAVIGTSVIAIVSPICALTLTRLRKQMYTYSQVLLALHYAAERVGFDSEL